MKKLLAVILVLAMVLSMSAVAFALPAPAQQSPDSGEGAGQPSGVPVGGGGGGAASNTQTQTVTNSDGTQVTTTTSTDGTKEVATVTKDGSETVTTTLSTTAANKATDAAPYTTTAVTAAEDDSTAPTVKVTVPAGASGGDAVVEFAVKNNSNKVALKIKNADGSYTTVSMAAAGENGPVANVKGTHEYILVENEKEFTDVAAGEQKNAADFVSSRELMIGETDTEFRPNEAIDGDTMRTVLGRLNGDITVEESTGKTWEEAGNKWADENGYGKAAEMPRVDMATNFYKFAGSPAVTEADKAAVKAFSDADGLTDSQVTAFAWLVKNGIIKGAGNNTLDWAGTAKRIEFALMLERYVNAIVK